MSKKIEMVVCYSFQFDSEEEFKGFEFEEDQAGLDVDILEAYSSDDTVHFSGDIDKTKMLRSVTVIKK